MLFRKAGNDLPVSDPPEANGLLIMERIDKTSGFDFVYVRKCLEITGTFLCLPSIPRFAKH